MWQTECLVDRLNANMAIKIIIKYFIWPFLNAISAFYFKKKNHLRKFKKKIYEKQLNFFFHNVVQVLQLVLHVLHKPNPATKNSNPSQEHKPSNQELKSQEHKPRTHPSQEREPSNQNSNHKNANPATKTQITITRTQQPKLKSQ